MAEEFSDDDTYTEDDSLQEISDYNSKSDFSKARLACEAISACRLNRAKEMRPGYENISVPKSGIPIKTTIEDSRKVYIGSVKALSLLLAPECKKDEEYKKIDAVLTIKEVSALDKFSYEEKEVIIKLDKYGYSKPMIEKTGRKFMPRIGDIVTVIDSKGFATDRKGGWDSNHNAYIDLLVDIYDERFSALSELIDRLNYFKNQSSF